MKKLKELWAKIPERNQQRIENTLISLVIMASGANVETCQFALSLFAKFGGA